jgi:hypothetical protein
MLKPILLVEDNPKDVELSMVALGKSQLANLHREDSVLDADLVRLVRDNPQNPTNSKDHA